MERTRATSDGKLPSLAKWISATGLSADRTCERGGDYWLKGKRRGDGLLYSEEEPVEEYERSREKL